MTGAAGFLLSPVAALAGLFSKPKAPKIPAQQPVAVDKSSTAVLDAVSGRTGSLANRRTGARAVEPESGKKTSLGG